MIKKIKIMKSGFENWDEYSTDGKTYHKLICRGGLVRAYLDCSKKEYERRTR